MKNDKRSIGRDPHIAPGVYYIQEELCARIDGDRIIVEKKESEDERIRKELKEAFEAYDIESKWNGIPIRSIFAWLEKQKEPLPIPDKFSELNSLMLQYFQSAVKRNDDTEIESDTDLWGRKILDYVRKHDEKQKEQKPWKVGANAYFTPEQKPADLSKMMVHKEPYIAPVPTPMVADEQKSIEWSEDFEENIRKLLHDKLTWHSEDGRVSSTVFIDDKTLKDIINGIWFYVGKEALKHPSKELNVTEWSDEDDMLMDELESYILYDEEFNDEQKSWRINRLKSLRPSWKPSEEQQSGSSALKAEGTNE